MSDETTLPLWLQIAEEFHLTTRQVAELKDLIALGNIQTLLAVNNQTARVLFEIDVEERVSRWLTLTQESTSDEALSAYMAFLETERLRIMYLQSPAQILM